MLTRILLQSNAASWLLALGLCRSWGSLPEMIGWLFVFAVYLGMLLWRLIELEHIEGLPLPAPPFRFVGSSERPRPPPRKP